MKKFLAYFAAIAFVLLASVAYCNYRYDGTGVLNKNLSGVRMTPNQEFCKVRHILRNPDRYDSFCFGSSRVTTLDLERIRDGGRWYNMTYAGGGPQQWLHDMHELIDHGIHVSTILVGIDDISWRGELFEKKQADVYQRSYTDWAFSYYLGLLFHMPSPLPHPIIVQEKGSLFDLYGTGRTFSPWIDEAAEKAPEEYRHNPRFFVPFSEPDRGYYAEQLQALKEMKQLADEKGIRIVFFLNPTITATYLNDDKSELRRWKEDIAEIADFYDFTGLNEIATDNFNFLDTSHYREIVGNKMIDRMMNGGPEPVPGFGFLVNKDNLAEHEARLAEQAAAWMAAHPAELEWYAVGRGLAPLPDEVQAKQPEIGLAYNLESVGGRPYDPNAGCSLEKPLEIKGWFQIADETPRLVLACLTDESGETLGILMNQDIRPDLLGQLNGSDDALHAGFITQANLSGLREGSCKLYFLAQSKDGRRWVRSSEKLVHMVK